MLGQIPLFEGLNKKELQFIASMTSEVSVRAGSTLVKQGEPGQEAMVVETGSGVVIRDEEEIDTIRAASDMRVLVMNSREFSSVLSQSPEVAVKILKTVVARLIKAQGGAS
jgi:CRP-like cAMP-binding protein